MTFTRRSFLKLLGWLGLAPAGFLPEPEPEDYEWIQWDNPNPPDVIPDIPMPDNMFEVTHICSSFDCDHVYITDEEKS